MKIFSIFFLILGLSVCTPACGLLSSNTASGVVTNATALAFDGAVVALQVFDAKEAAYIDSLQNPTIEDVAIATEQVARLQRARDSLQLVRGYLAGETDKDLITSLKSAIAELLMVAEELKADRVDIPQNVLDGLNQAARTVGLL
ncbi:MAG: hypothetical protein KGL39_18050 [Patescibacteria group bacterium]|nr:hypothetical protein [Patescibacteria group bacterium]